MTLPTLYPAQVGSPYSPLAVAYTSGESTMTLVDATKLPTAPNIVCLAGDVAGEFSYTGKEGNVLQGVTALPGTPVATTWPAGTFAFRGIAAYDLNAIHENMVRTATYVVAASNAPAHVKQQADYVCDGTADEVQILAAMSSGGRVILSEGDFYLTAADLQMHSDTTLQGQGASTVIHFVAKRIDVMGGRANVTIRDLVIDATNLGGRDGIPITTSTNIRFENLIIQNQPILHSFFICPGGSEIYYQDLIFDEVARPFNLTGSDNVIIEGCYRDDDSTNAMIVSGSVSALRIRNNVVKNCPLISHSNHNGGSESERILIEGNVIEGYHDAYAIIVDSGDLGFANNNVIIHGNTIVAAAATQGYNAIAVYGAATNWVVANNTVDQSLSGHNAIGISNATDGVVIGNVVTGCTSSEEGGIEIEANPIHGGGPGHAERVLVIGNYVSDCTWGIYTRTMSPTHAGWLGSPQGPHDVQISDNYVFDSSVGIALITGDKVVAKNNYLDTNTANLSVDPAVTNATVIANTGYVTENKGAAASTADGGTIAHGCAAAPTIVTVSGSVAGEIVTVTSIDATNITVAIKKPDGSAGTAQTVYWRAEV